MELTVRPDNAGKRLDSFLHEQLPEFSRSRIQSWIKEECVLVNGKSCRASYLLHGGELLSVTPAPLPPLKAEAEDLPLEVIYEDRSVIVIDKPAGMVVHAGAGHSRGTLVNALLHRFGALSSVNGDLRPGIVHRLDRDTSGVLVVARTDAAHQFLAKQFQDRTVEKTYLGLVHGRMDYPSGQIIAPITRDPVRRTRMTAKLASGRSAHTEYRVLKEIGPFSLLEVQIKTGRTHQIRVHLSGIGHSIVGDRLYGAPASPLGRFFLHAHRLRFLSPESKQPIVAESPLAPELQIFLDGLRREQG